MIWDKICLDEGKGGLGVSDVSSSNISLLGKWWDKFYSNEKNLWKQIILHKYYKGESWRNIEDLQCASVSRVWSYIVGLGHGSLASYGIFNNCFKWCLGSGNSINFWKSTWCGTNPLSQVFPRAFSLSVATCILLKMEYHLGTFHGSEPLVAELHQRLRNYLICYSEFKSIPTALTRECGFMEEEKTTHQLWHTLYCNHMVEFLRKYSALVSGTSSLQRKSVYSAGGSFYKDFQPKLSS